MTIYELPSIVKQTIPLAATPINIMSGFNKSGIWPVNRYIFGDSDYAPSFVTDRPQPITTQPIVTESEASIVAGSSGVRNQVSNTNTPESVDDSNLDLNLSFELGPARMLDLTPIPNVSISEVINDIENSNPEPGPSGIQKNSTAFTPAIVRPLPKALPRQNKVRRKVRKAAILTDTPEKDALAKEHSEREKKIAASSKRGRSQNKSQNKNKLKGKGKGIIKKKQRLAKDKIKKKILLESSTESESDADECFCIVCAESYKESVSGEDWVQCLQCKQWAHVKCTEGDTILFVCLNCQSDDESVSE